jgi:hypothetical protein
MAYNCIQMLRSNDFWFKIKNLPRTFIFVKFHISIKFVLIHFKPKMESDENFKAFLMLIIIWCTVTLGTLLVALIFKNNKSGEGNRKARFIMLITSGISMYIASQCYEDYIGGIDHVTSKALRIGLSILFVLLEIFGLYGFYVTA